MKDYHEAKTLPKEKAATLQVRESHVIDIQFQNNASTITRKVHHAG